MPRPTMADVAHAADVSVMTVSYSFNQPTRVSDATRTKVLEVAHGLGYSGPHRGAQSLRSGKTNNVGVVLTEKLTYAFEDTQARRFLAGVAEACLDTDTGLVLLPNSRLGADVDRIRDAQVDGFVVWTTTYDDPMLDAVLTTGKRVCVQGGPGKPGLQSIAIDDVVAAQSIAAIGLEGARAPAILSLPRDPLRIAESVDGADPLSAEFPVTRHRLQGYRAACERAGFAWPDVAVWFAPSNSRSEAQRLAHTILDPADPSRPDVIIAMTDELAFGVLDAATSLGISVPRDLAVTGWDDSDEAESAGLTTVRQSLFDQGRDAARWVLGSIDHIDTPSWSLCERATSR